MNYPWVLAGFILFIPMILHDFLSAREKRIMKILTGDLRKRLLFSRFFFRLFLACMIIALAGPRWGIGYSAGEYRRQADAVIAIDISRSMEVTDGLPFNENNPAVSHGGITRLERGLSIAAETVDSLPEMRFAVALSRGTGIAAIPLTWDNATVLALLQAIDGSTLTGRGTNLESLIDTAAGMFAGSGLSAREIILVSDGEALSGSFKAAVNRCMQNGIAVTALITGSDEGGIVPGPEGIFSRRDTTAMRMAAAQTNGVFIDGNREDAVEMLMARLKSLAPESAENGIRKETKARWFLFVMLGIIFYAASKICTRRIKNRE